jgi:hypothetical protein
MVRTLVVVLCVSTALLAETPATAPTQKPRIFITDSDSWEMRGSAGGSNGSWGAHLSGGARPQTAEIIKTFGERCSNVTVNSNPALGDYAVVLEHEGGKGYLRKRNKVAVFNKAGDSIFSDSTRSVGSSVEDACAAIAKDWAANGGKPAVDPAKVSPVVLNEAPQSNARLNVSSTPSGADIEVDGMFVGNTPSALELPAGEHLVTLKKSGFTNWEKKIKITGGAVNINAELEKK